MTWENKFHFTDWNQVLAEATIVSDGDSLASPIFFYVASMLLMYEADLQIALIRRFLYVLSQFKRTCFKSFFKASAAVRLILF